MDSPIAGNGDQNWNDAWDPFFNGEGTSRTGHPVLSFSLVRDGFLRHFNPYNLRDLQCVLEMRLSKALMSEKELKEVYFQNVWGFRDGDFVLANWRVMSVEELQEAARRAHPYFDLYPGRYIYPPGKGDVDSMCTKEEILKEFGILRLVPLWVYLTAVSGTHVLRELKDRGVEDIMKSGLAGQYLEYASGAGLDLSVVYALADKCYDEEIGVAITRAAEGGHNEVIDALSRKYGAAVNEDSLTHAALFGHNGTIDHLVRAYGLDPKASDGDGRTALHNAALAGRENTIRHLIAIYGVDIQAKDCVGDTALDVAERQNHSGCVSLLVSHGASDVESDDAITSKYVYW